MADLYQSVGEMAQHELEGRDFVIDKRVRSEEVLILAIHGGPTERHTDLIAREIAGDEHSLYALIGKMKSGNKDRLHIRSELYREPRVEKMLETAHVVISIHGECDITEPYVMLGGLDEARPDRIGVRLEAAGFAVVDSKAGVRGRDPNNICNRGASGRGGVQCEISKKLRDDLAADATLLQSFVTAVRSELASLRDRMA